MRILYLPNAYSQQRQREKKRKIYPVLMAMEAEWYRRQGHEVVWNKPDLRPIPMTRHDDCQGWEEVYDKRFSGCIGAVKNKYLSPSMTFSIDQQFVSLEIIKHKLDKIRGKELVDMMAIGEKIT